MILSQLYQNSHMKTVTVAPQKLDVCLGWLSLYRRDLMSILRF